MMIHITSIINELRPLQVIGSQDITVSKVIQFDSENLDPSSIFWINEKNKEKLYHLKAGVVICPNMISIDQLPSCCTYLLFENPRSAFRKLLLCFFVPEKPVSQIASTAVLGKNVKIGNEVYIGDNTVIEDNVEIGNNVIIKHNNVILSGTVIKNNVMIGSNNTIGGIGFGYEKAADGSYEVIPHIGNVLIEEDVEIGNNTCIDRAVLGSTILRRNCKIDNLVHIAHGVIIGENSLIIAHAIIGGSTVIGNNVWVAPNASVINKTTVGDNATIGLGAVVVKPVHENEVVIGNPAKPLVKK